MRLGSSVKGLVVGLVLGAALLLTAALPTRSSGHQANRLVPAVILPTAPSRNAEVEMWASGHPVLVSNNPEYLDRTTPVPSALYRDHVDGPLRVFYHHANRLGRPLTVAVAVTNRSSEAVLLYRGGVGQGDNRFPDVAGQQALARYLQNRGDLDVVTLLERGESVYVAPQPVAPGQTVSGLLDLEPRPVVRTASLTPSLALAPPAAKIDLLVSVVVYAGLQPDPVGLAVSPGTPPRRVSGSLFYALGRGTLAHGERHGVVPLEPDFGPFTLSVDAAPYGPYRQAMLGEYELATSAVDGVRGYINGNYGVLYTLRFEGKEPSKQGVKMVLRPSGGAGHYVWRVEGRVIRTPRLTYEEGWHFLELAEEQKVVLETSLSGGSFGPQKLYVLPDARRRP